MSSTRLSSGCIEHIHRTKDTTTYPTLIVQILDIKKIQSTNTNATSDRYRTQISDGITYIQAMFATGCNDLIINNTVNTYSIVRITQYVVNVVSNKNVMIVMSMELVQQQPQLINNPVAVESYITSQFNNPSGIKDENKENNTTPIYMSTSKQQQPGAVIKTDHHKLEYQSINTLNPYQTLWAIKARVTAKSEMKSWTNQRGEGKLFSIDLLDSTGGQIRATMFNDAVDKFYHLFEQDRVYSISKGQLKLANKKFSRLPNDYEITLNSDAVVVQLDDDNDIQTQKFTFTSIDEINNIDPNSFIDIIGIVTNIGTISSINSQKIQKELKKRSITVTDQSLTSIELTMWNELAEKYNEIELSGNPVLAVKSVKVSDFGGRSLGTTFQSQIFVNPDRPESGRLRSWYTSTGNSATYENITKSNKSGELGSNGITRNTNERRQLSCVQDEHLGFKATPDYITTRACVTVVRGDPDKLPWYSACPSAECNKKVTDSGNGLWRCEKCNKDYPQCVPRYILSVLIADSSSGIWLLLFNEHAEKLLGYKASQLNELVINGQHDEFKRVLTAAQYKSFIFKFRCKADMQNDENRLRCQAVSIDDINYVQESKLLIDEIELYN